MEMGTGGALDSMLSGKTHSLLSLFSCSSAGLVGASYRFLAFRVRPVWVQLSYFLFLALVGSLALVTIKPSLPSFRPKYIDMLFLSTSALTVSGVATVEMEVLSLSHVVVYSLLMLLGGEVWVSFLGLLVRLPKYWGTNAVGRVDPLRLGSGRRPPGLANEHGIGSHATATTETAACYSVVEMPDQDASVNGFPADSFKDLRYRCLRAMAYIVFFYILLIHLSGSLFAFLYLSLVPSSKNVLKRKGIRILPFAISITISSFANGGFIPTNENMAVFIRNSGLLLLMFPLILAGNTMFPVFLRLVIWALRRITGRKEFQHMMENPQNVGFLHLMNGTRTRYLAATVASFLVAQVSLFCALQWKTAALAGLSWFQKVVAASFQSVNSRHAGESAFDLSTLSPGMLVLFIVMMYLPAYVSFWPLEDGNSSSEESGPNEGQKKRPNSSIGGPGRGVVDKLALSQLSYITIFVITLCIIERKKMAEDPVNFSLLNIVVEIISAYGNVGLSLGYSCARRITPDAACKDATYGFPGRFSTAGKLLIMFVMVFGRLKRYHMGGGKAWILA